MYDSLRTAYNRMGIKGVIRYMLQRAIDMQHYEDNIDTLLYFFNHYADIRTFPKATGDLRKLQEGDVLLLRIVDKVCKKYHLTYWLDAGTLLGAIRHKGFIPWDDDMDIIMMRSDYEKALTILKEELGKYGIRAEETYDNPIGRIGISYLHEQTGIFIDLFPNEFSTIDSMNQEELLKYDNQWSKYKKTWEKRKKKVNRETMFNLRKQYIPQICDEKQAKSILDCPEFGRKPIVYKKEAILPVKYASFEGFEFPVPRNSDYYLKRNYGANYMGFPKSGMEHHGDARGKLSEWAQRTNTNMDEINHQLQRILESI